VVDINMLAVSGGGCIGPSACTGERVGSRMTVCLLLWGGGAVVAPGRGEPGEFTDTDTCSRLHLTAAGHSTATCSWDGVGR
jgi:hypothetical protein